MIDFGNTLRTAREQKGLSCAQIAERTHMLVQQVEDLENERFKRIPAPIYGRGFVKLYCEAVGLDPKPLVAAFMALYNGEAPAPAKENDAMETIASTEPTAPTVAEPVADVPPEPQDPLFAFKAEAMGDTGRAGETPALRAEPDDGIRRAAGSGPSRFAAPTPIDDEPRWHFPRVRIPAVYLRFLALIGGALLILWLLYAGACALVSAMRKPATPAPRAGETPAMREKARAGETPALQGKARKAIDISPLYID